MSDNTDILTNATAAIEWLREDIARTEREFDAAQIKLETMRSLLTRLTGETPQKRRRRVWSVVAPAEEPNMEPAA